LGAVAPLLLGALAVPLDCLHDWLLTGRPLYWLSVPSGYTALISPNLAPSSPLETIKNELVHYRPALPLVGLAIVGLIALVLVKRRAIAFALSSLVGGVLLTVIYLSWRAVFVTPRYYEEADAPLLLLAAIGTGAVVVWLVGRAMGERQGWHRWRQLVSGGVAAVLALGVVVVDVPHGAVEPQLDQVASGYAAVESQVTTLRVILEAAPGGVPPGRTTNVSGVSYPVTDAASCRVFVPRAFLPLIAVETGAPLDALGDSYLAFRGGDYGELNPGQYVLHVAATDGRGGAYAPFEHPSQTVLRVSADRTVLVTPVYSDDNQGVWLVRIDAGSTG